MAIFQLNILEVVAGGGQELSHLNSTQKQKTFICIGTLGNPGTHQTQIKQQKTYSTKLTLTKFHLRNILITKIGRVCL